LQLGVISKLWDNYLVIQATKILQFIKQKRQLRKFFINCSDLHFFNIYQYLIFKHERQRKRNI
jgi:hypothetical protein